MNIDYTNATFKYAKPQGGGDADMIIVTQPNFKISVPIKEENADYVDIKERVDAGTLSIEAAD
tara:strand:+ start:392 stop:580 length:189 start_codon:yes stop_codon:yes gene_type:complete